MGYLTFSLKKTDKTIFLGAGRWLVLSRMSEGDGGWMQGNTIKSYVTTEHWPTGIAFEIRSSANENNWGKCHQNSSEFASLL